MAVVASGDTGPRAVPLRRPTSSRDLGGHAAPRASGRRQAGTERRGGEGRERAGCEERPGVRADAARLPTGRSAGGSQPREPGRWGARHMPGVHWSLGPPTLSPGPPLSLKSSLACSSRSPLPSWIQTVRPRATPPTRNKQPPARFRLPGDPSSGSSPSFCRKMTPWQPNLSLYTLQGPQHLSACV